MTKPDDLVRLAVDGVGLESLHSPHAFDTTVERLHAVCVQLGLTVFAVVDHSAEAERVDLRMPPTKLAIVGAPRAGTPLMLASPTCAIDLPLKLLIREEDGGAVSVTWNTGAYLAARHGVPEDMRRTLDGARDIALAVVSPR
jgi:uncharacterized protein (DUF302 family)